MKTPVPPAVSSTFLYTSLCGAGVTIHFYEAHIVSLMILT